MRILFLFWPLISVAQTIPPSIQEVDRYLGLPNWQSSFSRPQALTYDFSEITGKTTSVVSYRADSRLVESETVRISSFDENGKEVSVSDLRKADWESQHGNWVRFYISQTESFGYKMKIEEVQRVQTQIEINGVMTSVGALHVIVSGKNQIGWVLAQTYIITNELRGLGQLLLREETQNVFGAKVKRSHLIKSVAQ